MTHTLIYVLKMNKMNGKKRQLVWTNTFNFPIALAVGFIGLEAETDGDEAAVDDGAAIVIPSMDFCAACERNDREKL